MSFRLIVPTARLGKADLYREQVAEARQRAARTHAPALRDSLARSWVRLADEAGWIEDQRRAANKVDYV
jgi:hypothetical protein